MSDLLRLVLVLININQETILNWFGIEDPRYKDFAPNFQDYGIAETDIPVSPNVSLETLRLIVEGLWDKFQSGLSFSDIENVILVIALIRFIILAIRYNVKTSFLITCLGLAAAYLWYRHFIDVMFFYGEGFLTNRLTRTLGQEMKDMINMRRGFQAKVGYREGLGNPLGVLLFAIRTGSTNITHRIDPISMIFAKIPEPLKSNTDSIYYSIYRDIGPSFFRLIKKQAKDMSHLVSYMYVTRMGKRYCPYLIRWHWTFILIVSLFEPPFYGLVKRALYYLNEELIPNIEYPVIEGAGAEVEVKPDDEIVSSQYVPPAYNYISTTDDSQVLFEIEWVETLLTVCIISHVAFVLFALFHALCGQYFYFPFLTENTELHIGPRPIDSIYSGGYTAWQDPNEKNKLRLIPKLWYGWFGRGTMKKRSNSGRIQNFLKKLRKRFFKGLRKRFGR